jgi:hypothetical protein
MTALNKTGQRLALLQAVADGAVYRVFPLGPSKDYDEWDHGPGAENNIYSGFASRRQRVNARMRDLLAADLAELGESTTRKHKDNRPWQLTPAGEALLREWGGTP